MIAHRRLAPHPTIELFGLTWAAGMTALLGMPFISGFLLGFVTAWLACVYTVRRALDHHHR